MIKVLFIDDEKDFCKLLALNMSELNYDTYTCSNPTKAVSIAKKIMPDIIVLDIMMPKLSGFDIANIDNTFGAFKTQIIESGHQGATPPSNSNKDGYSRSEISKMTPQQINKLYKEDPSFLQKIH